MKREIISDAFDSIDREFIDEAAEYNNGEKRSSKSFALKWISAVACAAIVIVGAVSFYLKYGSPDDAQTADHDYDGTGIPLQYYQYNDIYEDDEDRSSRLYSKYSGYIDYQDGKYHITYDKISADLLNEKICNGIAEMEIHRKGSFQHNVTLYSIKGYSEDRIIAVQFEGDDRYIAFVNHNYSPSVLGEYIDDMNLPDSAEFYDNQYIQVYLDDNMHSPDAVYLSGNYGFVWDMLFSDRDLPNAFTDKSQHSERLCFIYRFPEIEHNDSFILTDDGYLIIYRSAAAFYIGKEKVLQFKNYITENCEYEILD